MSSLSRANAESAADATFTRLSTTDSLAVTDADGLSRAYAAIDEAETVAVQLSHRAIKVPIYSRFLLISMMLLVVGIPAGFLAEFVWGTHP